MATIAQWDINNECNLNCKHCRVSEKNDNEKLSLKEAKSLLSELWYNGTTMLNLSGGEPFLRSDIFEILDFAQKFEDIVITTNGTLLNEEKCKKLSTYNNIKLSISLDGLEETHDKFRRKKGAFRKVIDTLPILNKYKIRYAIKYTLSKETAKDAVELLNLVAKNGATEFNVRRVIVAGNAKEDMVLSNEEYTNIIRNLIQNCRKLGVKFRTGDPLLIPIFSEVWGIDIEKDDLCSKNNVRIIRIREKKSKPINSSAIIYNIKIDNNTDYTYVEDALSFLNSYLNIDLDFDIRRDLDDIIKMINFMEKENCISKTNPEVLQEWNYEKNDKLGITPDNISSGSALKIWWKCEKGHNYQAIVSNKVNQQTKCPYCANKKIIIGFNDLATTNPELLEEWDYEKNDKLGIKPENVVLNSTKIIHWKCKNGHEWTTTLNNRARGSNCPYCSGRYAISGENDIATLFPELLKEWDYEKNDQLGIKPQNVKKNTDKKVWWKCEKGHEYKSSIVNRTKSKGTCCPYCSGNKVLKGFNDIASTNPELLKEWDYSKNTIKPDEVTKGTHKKIWWICSNNHSYEATIPARRRGTGCPYCSGNKILVGFNDLATTNPELLEKWNYEKNNKLGIKPKSISKSYSKKVWWKCKNGHEYQRHVYNERKGSGRCPICKKLKL